MFISLQCIFLDTDTFPIFKLELFFIVVEFLSGLTNELTGLFFFFFPLDQCFRLYVPHVPKNPLKTFLNYNILGPVPDLMN